MHKGTGADVWTELAAWTESLTPDEKLAEQSGQANPQPMSGISKSQLRKYLPVNDTLLLKRDAKEAPQRRNRQ
eukprot:8418250-Pyramimonas_sp.AAC.1